MLGENGKYIHIDDPLKVYYSLLDDQNPIALPDHHNTTNKLLDLITPVVKERFLQETGRDLPLKFFTMFPLYEHVLAPIASIQRDVVKNHRVEGLTVDQAVEPDWKGIDGLKALRNYGFTNIMVTGALGEESQAAVQDFYQSRKIGELLKAILGRLDGELVPHLKSRYNQLLKGSVGIDDQLRVLFYSYAINGTDALWINNSLNPEKGEGIENVCPFIEKTPYFRVVRKVLHLSSLEVQVFKRKVFGPYANVGIAVADAVYTHLDYFKELGVTRQKERRRLTWQEIEQLLRSQ